MLEKTYLNYKELKKDLKKMGIIVFKPFKGLDITNRFKFNGKVFEYEKRDKQNIWDLKEK